MATEDWELDFSNPPRISPPHVACMQCGEPVLRTQAATKDYLDETDVPQTAHFCPDTLFQEDSCQQKWYMTQLRKGGL